MKGVPLWSYDRIHDGSQLAECLKNIDKKSDYYSGLVTLQLNDGRVTMNVRMAILNLFLYPILTKFNIPISVRHVVKYKPFNNSVMTKDLNEYFYEIMDLDPNNADALKRQVLEVYNQLYAFCSIDILDYVSSFDITDLAEIVHDPAMSEIMANKEKITPSMGSGAIEKYIETNTNKMMTLIKTPGALKNRSLLSYALIDQLSKFQLPQSMYSFGMRTDINDTLINFPVLGSSVDGLRNIIEFVIESLTAKKSIFYNFNSVPRSQYMNRLQQLQGAIIKTLYREACVGAKMIPFTIRDYNHSTMIGRFVELNGKRMYIDHRNSGDFIDREVMMHSPCTCTYVNGVCLRCGSRVYENLHPTSSPGIIASLTMIKEITQKILSAKHFIKTNSIIYDLPAEISKMMYMASANEIRWRSRIGRALDNVKIGIPLKEFGVIHDVTMLRRDRPKENKFGNITHMHIKAADGSKHTFPLSSDHQSPHCSNDFLYHMRDHYNNIDIEDQIAWIPAKGTEKFPMFKTSIINDSMILFVNDVSSFLRSNMVNYNSVPELLHDFSKLVHSKSDCTMVHVETLLKTYMVTSPEDFRIPIVTDINNVMFQNSHTILNNRDIGTKLAYEEIADFVVQPRTYTTLKQASVFDIFTRPL